MRRKKGRNSLKINKHKIKDGQSDRYENVAV